MPRAKFLLKLFSKSLSRAAGETAVARRNERNFSSALFFLLSFFFCALCVKRKSVMGEEFVKNGPSRTPVPTGFGENFDILSVGEDIILPFFIKLNPYLFQQVILSERSESNFWEGER